MRYQQVWHSTPLLLTAAVAFATAVVVAAEVATAVVVAVAAAV